MFDCQGAQYTVATTLRFDEAGVASCRMQRSVRRSGDERDRVVEDVLLAVWPSTVLAQVASGAGFTVGQTTWAAFMDEGSSHVAPEPVLFICHPAGRPPSQSAIGVSG